MVVIFPNLFSHVLRNRFCLEYWLSLSTMSCFIVESSSTSAALGWSWFPRTSFSVRNKRKKRNSFPLSFSGVSFSQFIHSFRCSFLTVKHYRRVFNICGSVHHALYWWNKSNKMQQLRFLFAMALLYMFRVTISPIIRITMLYMATGELAHLGCY